MRQLGPIAALAVAGVLAAVLASPGARAQGIASNADAPREGEEIKGDTKVAEIREIERGLHLAVDFGPNYFLNIAAPGFVSLNQNWLTPGTRMGVRAGYDILNNIDVDVFVLANFNKGQFDQNRFVAGQLTGDVAHFVPGVGARFAFITNDRLFVYSRLAAGYAFWFPKELANDAFGSIHTDLSLGVEYYTKLRHLSAGLEVDVQALFLPFAIGFQVYPTVKYTF